MRPAAFPASLPACTKLPEALSGTKRKGLSGGKERPDRGRRPLRCHVRHVSSKKGLFRISLEKETPKEAVCTVFEKVNMGGVALTVFELVTASFAAETDVFSLRDDWELRRKRMYSFSGTLQGVAGDHFLQAISLLKNPRGPETGDTPRYAGEPSARHRLQEATRSGP